MAAHGVLLHGHQDALHVLDALVHLIAAEDQLGELDVVGREVVVDLGPVVLVNLVVHDSHASPQGLVHVKEKVIGGVQHLTSDLDGRGDAGAHDSLNGRCILGGQGQGITLPVDGGRVDSVRVSILQVGCVLHVLCVHVCGQLFAHLLDGPQVVPRLTQPLREVVELIGRLTTQTPGEVCHEDSELALGQVPEVLELLQSVKQIQVVLEGQAKVVREDWKSG